MKFLILLVALSAAFVTFSQDIIETRSGEQIKGKVYEITDTHVRYYREDQPNGPIRNISTSEIRVITYADGSKERFVLSQPESAKEPNPIEAKEDPTPLKD